MNFKDLKKVSEDKESAVFAHPRGHKVTVVKKVLSPKMRDDISKIPLHLAEGSEAPVEDPSKLPEQAPQQQQPTTVINVGTPAPAQPAPVAEVPMMQRFGNHIGNSIRESVQDTAQAVGDVASPIVNAGRGFLQGLASPQQQAVQAAASMQPPEVPQAPAAPQMPQMAPAQAPQTPVDPMAGMYQQMMAGPQQMMQGTMAEAKAQGQLGQATADLYHQSGQQQQKALETYQSNYQAAQTEIDHSIQDLKDGHIKPTQFVDNMSLTGKIATGIGLILGGMGSGLLHTENPVMKMLENNINRDVAAQSKDMENKRSIMSANFDKLKNVQSAAEMTKAMQWGLVSTNLLEAAAKSQSPLAMAAAQKRSGEIATQYVNPLIQSVAQRQMMMQMMNPQSGVAAGSQDPTAVQARQLDYLRMTNPEMAKSMEGRFLPGVGMAQVPVPDKERGEINARVSLDKAVTDLRQFAEQHGGTITDRAVVNEGKAKAALVQDIYRRANGQGVFREGEKDFVESILGSDPTQLFGNIRTLPRYDALIKANEDELNQLKKSYGVPTKFQPASMKPYMGKK